MSFSSSLAVLRSNGIIFSKLVPFDRPEVLEIFSRLVAEIITFNKFGE